MTQKGTSTYVRSTYHPDPARHHERLIALLTKQYARQPSWEVKQAADLIQRLFQQATEQRTHNR